MSIATMWSRLVHKLKSRNTTAHAPVTVIHDAVPVIPSIPIPPEETTDVDRVATPQSDIVGSIDWALVDGIVDRSFELWSKIEKEKTENKDVPKGKDTNDNEIENGNSPVVPRVVSMDLSPSAKLQRLRQRALQPLTNR